MSNVNQAFLRAYIKNRASTELPPTQPIAADTERSHGVTSAQPQPEPAMHLRIDRSSAIGQRPAAAPSTPLSSTNPQPNEPVPTRSGYWSPLGVERGMKGSVTPSTPPAVVRNGTTAVPLHATVQRVDPPHTQVRSTPAPIHAGQSTPIASTTVPAINAASSHRRNSNPILPPRTQTSAQTQNPANAGIANAGIQSNLAPAAAYRQGPAPENFVKQRAPALKLPPRNPIELPPASFEQPTFVQPPVTQPPSGQVPTSPSPAMQEPKSIYYPPQNRVDSPANTGIRGPHFREAAQPVGNPAPSITTQRPPTAKPADKASLQKLPLPVAFTPSWEVDSFFWPEVVNRLEQANPVAFRQIGQHLVQVNQAGLKVMAVTSGERGVGRSTVTMHLARAAATAGLKVAVVDADAFSPSLVDQLRLDIEHGWQNCLFEAVPLEEAAVHSIADQVTLFPLTSIVSQQQLHANLHRMAKLVKRIATAFDMVFLDSCRLNLDQRDLVGVSNEVTIDAAVLVVDTELSVKEKIDSAISILQGMGLGSIGLVENFKA